MGVFDSMLIKYGATLVGYGILGIPIFGARNIKYKKNDKLDTGAITKDHTTNSSLLINMSKAIGKLLVSYKDIQNLAGYTSSVSDMNKVLDEIKLGKFKKSEEHEKLLSNYKGGEINESDIISFQDVPIVTPTGDLLVNKITFTIKEGCHTLIVGPNGCGKSSIFRILGELWPLMGGTLTKPKMKDLFYIPQVF
jgi:ATP-binding cassette subfamily D (ALD) protein 3